VLLAFLLLLELLFSELPLLLFQFGLLFSEFGSFLGQTRPLLCEGRISRDVLLFTRSLVMLACGLDSTSVITYGRVTAGQERGGKEQQREEVSFCGHLFYLLEVVMYRRIRPLIRDFNIFRIRKWGLSSYTRWPMV